MKYYMKTMGNHDLLQKNEEIILAREIQILIKWEELREELESELLRWVPPICDFPKLPHFIYEFNHLC